MKPKSLWKKAWAWICKKFEEARDFFRAADDATNAATVSLTAIKHDPSLAHAAVAVVEAVVPVPVRKGVGAVLQSGIGKIAVCSNKLHLATVTTALTKFTAASALSVGTGALAAIGIIGFIGATWIFFRAVTAAKEWFDTIGGWQGFWEQIGLLFGVA